MTKVLIADDERVARRVLQATLEKNGYDVVVAEDGLQAWRHLTSDSDLRLAILDWMMPGLNGVQVCQKLQKEYRAGLVYVVLLTAKEGVQNLTAALQSGASDYVTKPYSKDELLARLRVGERLVQLQAHLTHAQKMESIGQLAAGIAHEINTPIQYVRENARFLQEAFADLQTLLDHYGQLLETSPPASATTAAKMRALLQELDVAYLGAEVPKTLEQSLEGIAHINEVVGALKRFAQPGVEHDVDIDLNDVVLSTLTITRSRWEPVANVTTELADDLPALVGQPGEISQIVLNLLNNASDAIAGKVRAGTAKGHLRVVTARRGSLVAFSVSDDGVGMSEDVRQQVFNPFFTTKQAGQGTGQGLTVVHNLVTDRYGGTVECVSQPGQGSTFSVHLPSTRESRPVAVEAAP